MDFFKIIRNRKFKTKVKVKRNYVAKKKKLSKKFRFKSMKLDRQKEKLNIIEKQSDYSFR
jgi:hypothetical protein